MNWEKILWKRCCPSKVGGDRSKKVFKSKNGLKIHVGKSHKKVTTTPTIPLCLPLMDAYTPMVRKSSAGCCGSVSLEIEAPGVEVFHWRDPQFHKLPMKCPKCDFRSNSLNLSHVKKRFSSVQARFRHLGWDIQIIKLYDFKPMPISLSIAFLNVRNKNAQKSTQRCATTVSTSAPSTKTVETV